MIMLKTVSPKPGTPTAYIIDTKDGWSRGRSDVIDGIKVWLKGDSPCGSDSSRSPYHERAAYLVDCMLHFKIVNGEVVSAQKFVCGRKPHGFCPPLLALFDYIIANSDRHNGNWFVKPSGRVWAIDNALTFTKHVKDFYGITTEKLPYRIKYQLRLIDKKPQRLHRRLDNLIGVEAVNAVIKRIKNVVVSITKEEERSRQND